MIQVRFLGGAKKSFGTDGIMVERDEITLDGLLLLLMSDKKPADTPPLDARNTLVAVNGVDSSALAGRDTVIRSGDVVSLIPVIHGGSGGGGGRTRDGTPQTHISFVVRRTNVHVYPITGSGSRDHGFLDGLRAGHATPEIQAVSARFVLGKSHIEKIVGVSLEAQRRKILLADRLATDLLLRFAATTQISKAIADLGIRPNRDFVVIALGTKRALARVDRELSDISNPGLLSSGPDNKPFVKRYHKITKKHTDAISSKTPLEDLLLERASILF